MTETLDHPLFRLNQIEEKHHFWVINLFVTRRLRQIRKFCQLESLISTVLDFHLLFFHNITVQTPDNFHNVSSLGRLIELKRLMYTSVLYDIKL